MNTPDEIKAQRLKKAQEVAHKEMEFLASMIDKANNKQRSGLKLSPVDRALIMCGTRITNLTRACNKLIEDVQDLKNDPLTRIGGAVPDLAEFNGGKVEGCPHPQLRIIIEPDSRVHFECCVDGCGAKADNFMADELLEIEASGPPPSVSELVAANETNDTDGEPQPPKDAA